MWYTTVMPTASEQLLAYQGMIECKGVPVFRVDLKTKSRQGNGSRGKGVVEVQGYMYVREIRMKNIHFRLRMVTN